MPKVKACKGSQSWDSSASSPNTGVRTLTPDSQGHRDTKRARDMGHESEKPSQKHERKWKAGQGDTATQSDLEKLNELESRLRGALSAFPT